MMTDGAKRTDDGWMDIALDQARAAIGVCEPNPRVGCVLVAPTGQEISRGSTQQSGAAHAEVMALRQARERGHPTLGATAYVTLEPCAHQGRTGPCCDALVQAGVRRVVAALEDPNPLVAGNGFRRLRAAGVEVQVGLCAEAARELNIGFFSRMLRRKPWVRMKIAASLDGSTALRNGQSQWITGAAARADGHAWRARASAVLTGIGTVLDDDPRLDVREVAVQHQPHLVVVDSRLQLPPTAALFLPGRRLLVYAAESHPQQQAVLEQRGAQVIHLPTAEGRAAGKVDLAGMLADLAQRGVNELHIEAGSKLNGSLLREGLVDELLVYLAPRLLGPGQPLAALDTLSDLGAALPLRFRSATLVGDDLRVLARVPHERWY